MDFCSLGMMINIKASSVKVTRDGLSGVLANFVVKSHYDR